MGAPKGNQFWKLRSKHGRDKLFKTPELLWEAACEYFQWCDDNPWIVNAAAKAGDHFGELTQTPTARPYTINGLCIYLDCAESYFRNFNPDSKDFLTVLNKIKNIIYTQKFEGAAVGAFNPMIIARDLGLKDRTDHTSDDDPIKSTINLHYNDKKIDLKDE